MLVDREQSSMSKHIKACAAGNSVTLFKESHIAIKRAVVDVAGEQRTDAHCVCLLEYVMSFVFCILYFGHLPQACVSVTDPHRCHDRKHPTPSTPKHPQGFAHA